MESLGKSLWRKLAVLLTFAAMVTANYLSTNGLINHVTTAAVSDEYRSLFTPASYTFFIWGLVYLLLFIYVLFQLFSRDLGWDGRLSRIAVWFVFSCLLNIGWVFAWHYRQILVSTIAMIVLLYSLTRILSLIGGMENTFNRALSLELPFGLYAGWVVVATVGNIAAFLVSLQWDWLGIPTFVWLIAVLLLFTAFAVSTARGTRNIVFPGAVLWGLTGILVPNLPAFKLDVSLGAMWGVIALGLCILVLAVTWIDSIARRVR